MQTVSIQKSENEMIASIMCLHALSFSIRLVLSLALKEFERERLIRLLFEGVSQVVLVVMTECKRTDISPMCCLDAQPVEGHKSCAESVQGRCLGADWQ